MIPVSCFAVAVPKVHMTTRHFPLRCIQVHTQPKAEESSVSRMKNALLNVLLLTWLVLT